VFRFGSKLINLIFRNGFQICRPNISGVKWNGLKKCHAQSDHLGTFYFVRKFFRTFVRNFVRKFVRNFVRKFVRNFVRKFVRKFSRKFVRKFFFETLFESLVESFFENLYKPFVFLTSFVVEALHWFRCWHPNYRQSERRKND
jgi:hypothetical protein